MTIESVGSSSSNSKCTEHTETCVRNSDHAALTTATERNLQPRSFGILDRRAVLNE